MSGKGWLVGYPNLICHVGGRGEKKNRSRKGLRQKSPSEQLSLTQSCSIRKNPRESSNINK